jgi:hypothetical protein
VGVWGCGRCGRCGGVGSLLTFDIPQTALVATLDTYDFTKKSRHQNLTFEKYDLKLQNEILPSFLCCR